MQYQRLGKTPIEVSVLGFGAWGVGGRTPGATSYGETDDKVSLRALHHAAASGITLFDTSNVYGAGHSETLLGRAFKSVRNSVIIATKVGWNSYDGPSDFSAKGMRASLENSLRRLQTEYVDILQLHNPPTGWLQTQPDILNTLNTFVSEGKVRALGVSVRSPEDALALQDHPEIATIQSNFNMMDIRAQECQLLTRLQEHQQCLIARTPLCFGFLSGHIDRTTVFPDGDHRLGWPVAQRECWIEGSALFARLVQQHGAGPLYEAALRFCFSFQGVATVLAGMLTEDEVSRNVQAVEKGTLPTRLMDAILEEHGITRFFVHPASPTPPQGLDLAKM
ncbi:MAG: aldo/keto reductase [Ilumatobacteraceae bacterium]|jgi:aryl-alcohol dehydrogenase-like predicted oxidoreductase|nr:aldo/keto reductase [Ilumatobacteraceae bacterium]